MQAYTVSVSVPEDALDTYYTVVLEIPDLALFPELLCRKSLQREREAAFRIQIFETGTGTVLIISATQSAFYSENGNTIPTDVITFTARWNRLPGICRQAENYNSRTDRCAELYTGR